MPLDKNDCYWYYSNYCYYLKLKNSPSILTLNYKSVSVNWIEYHYYTEMQTLLLMILNRFQTPISTIYDSKEIWRCLHVEIWRYEMSSLCTKVR